MIWNSRCCHYLLLASGRGGGGELDVGDCWGSGCGGWQNFWESFNFLGRDLWSSALKAFILHAANQDHDLDRAIAISGPKLLLQMITSSTRLRITCGILNSLVGWDPSFGDLWGAGSLKLLLPLMCPLHCWWSHHSPHHSPHHPDHQNPLLGLHLVWSNVDQGKSLEACKNSK